MTDIEDLITDIGSIVSSVRPGEIMTLKRVEEDYKTIYGKSISFSQFGYCSLSKLLESFPNHFKCYITNGITTIRSNARNNITALIAKERKSKKPKNFQINQSQSNGARMRYTQIQRPIKKELPEKILREISQMVETYIDGFHKDRLLFKFKQSTGYEFKYQDFGFTNENDLLCYLNGRVLALHDDFAHPLSVKGPSLFDLLRYILSIKSGYTIGCLQQRVSQSTTTHIPTLIKSAGRFSFDEVIQDAKTRDVLCFDQHFVYGATQRCSSPNPPYPHGISNIQVLHVVSPSNFIFEIVRNDYVAPRTQLHDKMQKLAVNEPLIAMLNDNRYCSLKYKDEWYRVIIDDIHCDIIRQRVTVHFVDFSFEVERGVEVSLPTDRLRFVPVELEAVPAFVHRGSLAYVCAVGGRQWSRQSCDIFGSLTTDSSCTYQSYLVDQTSESISIDIVSLTVDGDRSSLFQRLVGINMAQSIL